MGIAGVIIGRKRIKVYHILHCRVPDDWIVEMAPRFCRGRIRSTSLIRSIWDMRLDLSIFQSVIRGLDMTIVSLNSQKMQTNSI